MKRIFIAIVLLIFIIIVCVASSIIIDNCTKDITTQLDTIYDIDFENQKNSALNLTYKLKKNWTDYGFWYSIFFQQSYLDEISVKIKLLPTLIENNDFEAAKIDCIEIQVLLEKLISSEKISVGTIF